MIKNHPLEKNPHVDIFLERNPHLDLDDNLQGPYGAIRRWVGNQVTGTAPQADS